MQICNKALTLRVHRLSFLPFKINIISERGCHFHLHHHRKIVNLSDSHSLETMSSSTKNIPKPPPLPRVTYQRSLQASSRTKPWSSSRCLVPKETVETWDKVFREGIGADTTVQTEDNYHLLAHSSILSAASPVLANLLNQSRDREGRAYLKISGVPYEPVYMFLRFMYTSCYEEYDMKKCVIPLILLSHLYSVPSLKRVCVEVLDNGYINKENVVDVLQLGRTCDATRICFLCITMVIKDFESISQTDGWKEMIRYDPLLEQELEAVVEAQTRRRERRIKLEEKKTYLELYEALEALVHIYREGCVTIGPRDKPLVKGSQTECEFRLCKGVEGALRHFLGCKSRASCLRCKRVRQLFQLHACVCDDSDSCGVPLCRNLMEKKGESKWRLLAEKVTTAKDSLGPFSPRLFALA